MLIKHVLSLSSRNFCMNGITWFPLDRVGVKTAMPIFKLQVKTQGSLYNFPP